MELPTGYGKSLIYMLYIRRDAGLIDKSVVLVVEPLTALAADQVKRAESLNLQPAILSYYGDSCGEFKNSGGSVSVSDHELYSDVCSGKYHILFTSPEAIIQDPFWKKLLLEPALKNRLSAIVVDEAHCILEWGHEFRPAYGELDSVTAQVPHVPVVALTASATPSTIDDISKSLCMRHPVHITASPNRPNIYYSIQRKESSLDSDFGYLIEELRVKRHETPRTIVYCTSVLECGVLYNQLATEISEEEQYLPIGCSPGPQHRLFNQYHRPTPDSQNTIILDGIKKVGGVMRVILSTVALGLGVDFPDVERVIHYGCPQTLEQFYQESGRGGRSGQRAMSVLYFNRHDVREDRVKPEMRNYCLAGYCLRRAIVEHFGFKLAEGVQVHECCSVCNCEP